MTEGIYKNQFHYLYLDKNWYFPTNFKIGLKYWYKFYILFVIFHGKSMIISDSLRMHFFLSYYKLKRYIYFLKNGDDKGRR